MPTVGEILATMFEGNETSEKVAEVNTQVGGIEKFAADNGISTEEAIALSQEIDADEAEKVAHEEAEKQASEAVHMGRFMARGFYDELAKLGGVGGSEPTTTDQGASVPQDGSVANRIAEKLSVMHGEKNTPKKEELKAALVAQRANFVAGGSEEVEPKPALATDAK